MQDTMQCGGKPRVRTRWTTFRSLRASLLLCQMAILERARYKAAALDSAALRLTTGVQSPDYRHASNCV